MKIRITLITLEALLGTAAYLYATLLLYQEMGMWAIAVGTSFFAVTYIAIALNISSPNKKKS